MSILPLVADCDRARVLASWAPFCGGQGPCQRFIPFAAVRSMSPEEFVRVLALDLKVRTTQSSIVRMLGYNRVKGTTPCKSKISAAPSTTLCVQVAGVVVGMGFRFGYKASGDTQALLSLGQHYGLRVSVVDLVAETGTLKVRHQLCAGHQTCCCSHSKLPAPYTATPCSDQANIALADETGILFRCSVGAGRGGHRPGQQNAGPPAQACGANVRRAEVR